MDVPVVSSLLMTLMKLGQNVPNIKRNLICLLLKKDIGRCYSPPAPRIGNLWVKKKKRYC